MLFDMLLHLHLYMLLHLHLILHLHLHMHLQSWEAIDPDTAAFTPDISPLILAAHTDNYEIIKILLDRGSVLPCPHHQRYLPTLPSPHHQR